MNGSLVKTLTITDGTGTQDWPDLLDGKYSGSITGAFTSGTLDLKFSVDINEGDTPEYVEDQAGAIQFSAKKAFNIEWHGLMTVEKASFVGTVVLKLKKINK